MVGKTLVFGYGNPGRQDDGLGPAAAAIIERLGLDNVQVEISYLLSIEDAAEAAEADLVLFVDAAESGPEPFAVRELTPSNEVAFTSHIVKPEVILGICRQCFGRAPNAWLIAIRGYEFELEEALTDRARENLGRAVARLRAIIDAESRSNERKNEPVEQIP